MKTHFFTNLVNIIAITVLLTAVAYTQTCPGSSGCLDTTFGNAGFVAETVNGGLASGWATAVAIQPADGKIVVSVESANPENTSAEDNYVMRFNADGTRDTTFGTNGVVRYAFTTAADHEWPAAVAIQSDGKIVVGSSVPGYLTGVARLNPDGSLDPSFGSGGKVTFNVLSRQSGVPWSIVVQSDGRIAMAINGGSFSLVRLLPNGKLDTGFNGTGKLVAVTPKGNQTAAAVDVGIQSDGKYLLSGMLPTQQSPRGQFAVMRITSNGTIDTSFGSKGMVITDFGGSWSVARNVDVQSDGKIVAGGDWLAGGTNGNQSFVFIRYQPNGQLDSSFGSGGKALFGSPDFRRMTGMAIQADGKIVGSGWDRNPNVTNSNVLIMRIDPSGVLDPSFGSGGVTITDYNGASDEGDAMAVQADGKFVLAGTINGYSPAYIGLYRYLP